MKNKIPSFLELENEKILKEELKCFSELVPYNNLMFDENNMCVSFQSFGEAIEYITTGERLEFKLPLPKICKWILYNRIFFKKNILSHCV
jgi:hypothetical protein